MENMSIQLIDSANTSLQQLTDLYLNSSLTHNQRLYIQSIINEQTSNLNEVESLINDEKFYSAASVGVQILINTIYGRNLINYYSSNNRSSFVEGLVNSTFYSINNTEQRINEKRKLDSIYEANQEYLQGDYNNAIYDISYAKAREITAIEWFDATNIINENKSIIFDSEKLKNLANERLEQANNMITYAQTVFSQTSLTSATNHLKKSEEAYKTGQYVYSIFESLQSIAESSLSMEIRGLTYSELDDKISYKTEDVNKVINRVEDNGYLPILSISYYEFASKFKENDPLTCLIYLEYAKQFSSISQDFIEAFAEYKTNNNSTYTITQYNIIGDEQNIFKDLSILITGFFLGYAMYLFKRK